MHTRGAGDDFSGTFRASVDQTAMQQMLHCVFMLGWFVRGSFYGLVSKRVVSVHCPVVRDKKERGQSVPD